jgi:hypothetical protein
MKYEAKGKGNVVKEKKINELSEELNKRWKYNYCPIFYLNHGISETEFCLCLRVESMGPKERVSVSLQDTEISFVDETNLSRFHLKTERESSLRNVMLLNERKCDG